MQLFESILLIVDDRGTLRLLHVLVNLRKGQHRGSHVGMVETHMRVVEQRVHAPRVGFGPPVQEVEAWCLGEFTAVLMLQVFNVFSMLGFCVVNPCTADSD